jgi:hypothetical protein
MAAIRQKKFLKEKGSANLAPNRYDSKQPLRRVVNAARHLNVSSQRTPTCSLMS